jgi:hypothetical protein
LCLYRQRKHAGQSRRNIVAYSPGSHLGLICGNLLWFGSDSRI